MLIEAEGFDYPRLSMFVPDAKSIYERFQTSEPELKLHDTIKDTVEKIAELAHTEKTDFTSADSRISGAKGSAYINLNGTIELFLFIYWILNCVRPYTWHC
ncbi:MAG TPA: hypothetical protein P5191_00205 [Ruminococcus sp.]|nr:hypothetical protein [Ruminococcus sp.]